MAKGVAVTATGEEVLGEAFKAFLQMLVDEGVLVEVKSDHAEEE